LVQEPFFHFSGSLTPAIWSLAGQFGGIICPEFKNIRGQTNSEKFRGKKNRKNLFASEFLQFIDYF
jgi:hypothetical protein